MRKMTVQADGLSMLLKPRVCMGVWNSMRHDARVARAAATVAEAGAGVIVVAASWDPAEWGLKQHADKFRVFTVPRRAPWALSRRSPNVSGLGVVLRLLKLFPSFLNFTGKLWSVNADVYHAHDLQALPWVWLAAKLRGRPVIYDAHEISTDRTAFTRIGRIVTIVEGFLARRCKFMITTTDMRADFFADRYGVPRPVVIQNRPYFQEPARTNRIREAAGIADRMPLVLYQGGLQPGRGLEKLVEQIPHVKHARFVFLGNGALRDSLRSRVEALGESRRVYFLDAVPWQELLEWTASADIGVQLIENTGLNHYSTDSNKLFEYAMAGLPVLASDFPEIRKVVQEYGFGLLVDPADDRGIREQLVRLVGDSQLRESYATAALRGRGALSWETQKPKLLALYRPLLTASA